MVDSRDKGQRAEYAVRDLLREATGVQWERVPGSGGFNKSHGLKGDIYLPSGKNKVCVEVKHYADDVINSNLLRKSESQLEKFWNQTCREATEVEKLPLLVFKKDRGKWLCAVHKASDKVLMHMYLHFGKPIVKGFEGACYIYDFEEWLAKHSKELVNE